MPQRAKSNDKDFINELVARQDDVIGELDKLEAAILEAIESLSIARREDMESDVPVVASDLDSDSDSATDGTTAETFRMPDQNQPAADDNDRSSRAA